MFCMVEQVKNFLGYSCITRYVSSINHENDAGNSWLCIGDGVRTIETPGSFIRWQAFTGGKSIHCNYQNLQNNFCGDIF